MKKFLFILFIFVSFSSFSQTNPFTGTWSNENCKSCSKKYILIMNIAQSFGKVYGSAEVINSDPKLSTGSLEITGYIKGDKAYIKLESEKEISSNAILIVSENQLQFDKRNGSDLIPKEVILEKLYE